MRRFVLWLSMCVLPFAAWSQNSATDSQNLRALLEEMRQLRRDLATTTVAAQRVQIALYRLQLLDAAVARATKPVEEAHGRLSDLAAQRQRLADDTKKAENLRKRSQDAHEVRVIEEEALPEMKRHDERLAGEEQHWQAQATEAEARLRVEQAKLDSLHDLLDKLEQALESVASRNTITDPVMQRK